MALAILGIGTATPPHTMAQQDAAEATRAFCCRNERQARLLSTIYRHSEVRQRSSVILEEPNGSPIRQSFFPPAAAAEDRGPTTNDRMKRYAAEAVPLALSAVRAALAESGSQPEQISHLVTVSCTGFIAPGVDVALIKQLALLPTVTRTHVGFMGCHGAINGLRVAAAMAAAQPGAVVLLCAVELCSLHFHYGWDVEKIKANALFSDGAAAVVAAHLPAGSTAVASLPTSRLQLPAPGDQPKPSHPGAAEPWRVVATGSCLMPDSEDAMAWRVGDHGFEMSLSPRIPDLIRQNLRTWLETWLAEQGLSASQVRSWAVHPGGPRIVNGVAEALGLPESAVAVSREVLADCGNMSSPTLLFILDRLRRSSAQLPCVAIGFGPGLITEAALLR